MRAGEIMECVSLTISSAKHDVDVFLIGHA